MGKPLVIRSRAKYCEFHANHSHDTEDWVALRSEIEKMIKNGKLVGFHADQNQQGPRHERYPLRNDNGRQNEQR
jgi:hypothetical protein